MTRLVSITSAFGSLNLSRDQLVRLGLGVKGTGMPPVSLQTFEGAGDGAQVRTIRVLPRTMDLPIKIYGNNRREVEDLYRKVAVIFAPTAGPVRLTITLDGEAWYVDVVRQGGGDFAWDQDTDGTHYLKFVVTAFAGDPYWTRLDPASKKVELGGLGRGLIKKGTYPNATLSALRVSTTSSFGTINFDNPGDVPAFPIWTVRGPFTRFELVSPDGSRSVEYAFSKGINQWVTVDMANGTAVDETGANQYGKLTSLPGFWAIPPGTSSGTAEMDNPTSDSSAVALWNPKKWILF